MADLGDTCALTVLQVMLILRQLLCVIFATRIIHREMFLKTRILFRSLNQKTKLNMMGSTRER
ncbi:hypothetical protein GFK82_00161 [Candidatus Steffania adelgidicola]|nr:hypothetical protein GFK82_00161 [Candidatus Steffania adelgidicola]